jgi:hypothetical protein
MPNSPDTLLNLLADKLRAYLGRPLHLDEEAAAFVTATYGRVDAEAIRELFSDPEASEAQTLLEFLLFPNAELQRDIEPLLARLPSRCDLERRLRERLQSPPIDLTLVLDGGQLTLLLSEDLCDRFLTRLKLAKNWPPSLDSVLDACLKEDDRLHARVMLRNGPGAIGPGFAGLCMALLKKLPSHHRDFWPALDLVIQLTAELEGTDDPFALLTRHKQRAFQMVEQQREFERRLQGGNIEILMGQGQRVPILARAEAQRRMRIIDAVCQAVFGRTNYFQPAEFN